LKRSIVHGRHEELLRDSSLSSVFSQPMTLLSSTDIYFRAETNESELCPAHLSCPSGKEREELPL